MCSLRGRTLGKTKCQEGLISDVWMKSVILMSIGCGMKWTEHFGVWRISFFFFYKVSLYMFACVRWRLTQCVFFHSAVSL